MAGGTVIIDDFANGGSDAGAWLTHIAHTPALARQCRAETAADPMIPGRGGAGGTAGCSPTSPSAVPPTSSGAGA